MVWALRIAASLIIAATGFWMVNQFNQAAKEEKLALEAPAPENQATITDSVNAPPIVEEKNLKDERLGEASTSGPTEAKKKDEPSEAKPTENALETIENESLATTSGTSGAVTVQPQELKTEPALAEEKSDAKKEAIAVSEKKVTDFVMSSSEDVSRRKSLAAPLHTITGKVTAAEDGTPIPGVNVMVKGTSNGTVTDINGNYQINASQENPTLVFSFIGFQSQELVVNQNNSNVQLGTDATQLSEVVVTGYGFSNATEPREPVIKLAEPFGGRRAYDNYLKNSLRYPPQALENKIKGRVTVQFTVKTDGTLDEFNVLKSLGYGCDEEVIRLVKEGPRWSPTTEDNVPVESEVRVKVRFSPPN